MKKPIWKKISLSEIKPAEYNPRVMSKKAADGLGSSLDNYGYVIPILVNQNNNVIVSGHQRLKQLLERGVDEEIVGFLDLTPQEEVALNIAMNSPTLRGTYTAEAKDLVYELSKKIDDGVFKDMFFESILKQILSEEAEEEAKDKKEKPDKKEKKEDLAMDIPKEKLVIHCPKCFTYFKYLDKEVIREGKIPEGEVSL